MRIELICLLVIALGLLCTLLICMMISGVINDTPVLVLALPIILNLAQRGGVSAS